MKKKFFFFHRPREKIFIQPISGPTVRYKSVCISFESFRPRWRCHTLHTYNHVTNRLFIHWYTVLVVYIIVRISPFTVIMLSPTLVQIYFYCYLFITGCVYRFEKVQHISCNPTEIFWWLANNKLLFFVFDQQHKQSRNLINLLLILILQTKQ